MKADFKTPEGKIYYEKRANLNEVHFELLRNARNFQKLNRTGMKKCKKRINNTFNSHITYKKYTKN